VARGRQKDSFRSGADHTEARTGPDRRAIGVVADEREHLDRIDLEARQAEQSRTMHWSSRMNPVHSDGSVSRMARTPRAKARIGGPYTE